MWGDYCKCTVYLFVSRTTVYVQYAQYRPIGTMLPNNIKCRVGTADGLIISPLIQWGQPVAQAVQCSRIDEPGRLVRRSSIFKMAIKKESKTMAMPVIHLMPHYPTKRIGYTQEINNDIITVIHGVQYACKNKIKIKLAGCSPNVYF